MNKKKKCLINYEYMIWGIVAIAGILLILRIIGVI